MLGPSLPQLALFEAEGTLELGGEVGAGAGRDGGVLAPGRNNEGWDGERGVVTLGRLSWALVAWDVSFRELSIGDDVERPL